jgi:hypothetical protein
MAGGIRGFAPGVDLMFWTMAMAREGRVHANLIVLIRRPADGWQAQPRRPDPADLQPPAGATSGGSATIGPHLLEF